MKNTNSMRKRSLLTSYFPTNTSKSRKILLMLIGCIIALGISLCGYGIYRFYDNVLAELPPVTADGLQDLTVFSESSIITDKNGKELYKLFAENREYVSFDNISSHMVDATISTEDNSFWLNDGLDYFGIIRAVKDQIMVKIGMSNVRAGGASTITQQLVRALLLSRDKTIVRKLKEWVLTFDVDNAVETNVIKRYGGQLSAKEIQRKKKETIMELYLNIIFLGNNAYGVEAAANTYFAKSAKDLTILESSILAGTIQAPSVYNPYTNRIGTPRGECTEKIADRCQGIIGGFMIKNKGERVEMTGGLTDNIVERMQEKLDQRDIQKSNDNVAFLNFLQGETPMQISYDGKIYDATYLRGRKDTVLFRMYRENYIDQEELKQALIDGITLELKSKRVDIKAPHFVFWVRDYILNNEEFDALGIGEDTLLKGGLRIKTSLDLDLQQIGENTLAKYKKLANDNGASNRSILYVDSTNGDVLVYVGSLDYNDDTIDGKVDMLRAKRQPGSSVKPFIYAYAFQTTPLTLDTPVYDIPIKVGPNEPRNADRSFVGMQPIREALAGSRNIPAIKAYFAGGQQANLIPYLRSIGMTSLDPNGDYGYALSLGAGEVPALELAQAYAHLSTLGDAAVINPILEIRGPDGQIIYQKDVVKQERVLEAGPAYLVRSILSNDSNMPAGWPGQLRVYGFRNGTKSGTSNMVDEDNQSKPRDGRLALYTPNKVALTRAGNANSSPFEGFADRVNGPVMKDFFKELLDKGHIVQADHQPQDISQVTINRITGKLPAPGTPSDFIVNTQGYNKTIPSQQDTQMIPIVYDPLCAGAISEFTPENEIQQGFIIQPSSFIPDNRDLADITAWFQAGNFINTGKDTEFPRQERVRYNLSNIFVAAPTVPCEDRIPKEDLDIKISISFPEGGQGVASIFPINFGFISANRNRPITQVALFVDGKNVGTKRYQGATIQSDQIIMPTALSLGEHVIELVAVDNAGYANSIKQTIRVVEDTIGPNLDASKTTIEEVAEGYKVTVHFSDDLSAIKGGKILVTNDNIISFTGPQTTFTIPVLGSVGYIVADYNDNETRAIIELTQ